ncbi:MAG: transglycosylase SLT domain-containing protein [Paracoccaceae bacterium]|nr:transglycosylase SLT domain-containing protein [Paracoccaceae bacterium]
MILIKPLCLGACLAFIAACAQLPPAGPAAISASTSGRDLPRMGWDHRPEASDWTRTTLAAVADRDSALATLVPTDIALWCPGYARAGLQDRRAFWVGLLSAVAKHESRWNPKAAGGGGRYVGLMQISPATARNFGCEADSAGKLTDGAANLSCAVEIAAQQVGRDNAVAGQGRLGLGRDWMPFRKAATRTEMAAWTRVQSYCQ